MKDYQSIKKQFLLNPKINYLNHGSFGACPKPIFDDYQKWQLMLEQGPCQFIVNTGVKYLETSKKMLSDYINCNPKDLIFVPNPTMAMNIIIKNLVLKQGDEVLSTNHEYGAIDRTWKYYCEKSGAKYVQQEITLPLTSKEQFLEQFWSGLTSKTKIISISQITSSTALIFPVKEICKRAKELGLITIVDGAHVPGHIPLNLEELDVDIYSGACHKWLLTPKGNTFLYVKKEFQDIFDPLIISWGYDSINPSDSKFQDYHQYNGTRDFSAYLTIPAALQFFEQNNWEERKKECRDLLKHYYPIVAKQLNTNVICPLTDEFLGQICSIPIQSSNPIKLKETLYNKHNIEIPITYREKETYLRISFQAYNGEEEIEHLINALEKIKSSTNLLENI